MINKGYKIAYIAIEDCTLLIMNKWLILSAYFKCMFIKVEGEGAETISTEVSSSVIHYYSMRDKKQLVP